MTGITRARVLAAAFAVALCVPAAGITAGSGVPTTIGKGEGQLNLVAWEGYTQPQWVKPFQKLTGCQVHAKYAGSSDEMVTLMRQGGGSQYDMVSASGDASLRLIYGKDVQPINVNLIPDYKYFIPQLKSPPHNTIKGVHYGLSLQWGPNTLLYNTTKVKPAPTSWSAIYSAKYKGKVTVPDNPIQIADAALYLSKTKPSLGITDPYRARLDPVQRGGEPAEAAEAADQEVLGARLGRDRPLQERRRGDRRVVAVSDEHARSGQGRGEGPHPEGGRDGLGRHVDALGERQASELCIHVDEVGLDAESAGATGDLLRRDAGEHEGMRSDEHAVSWIRSAVPLRRLAGVFQLDQVLEDADRRLRQRQERLHGLHEMAAGVDTDEGLTAGRSRC